jgi:hypothetical protein
MKGDGKVYYMSSIVRESLITNATQIIGIYNKDDVIGIGLVHKTQEVFFTFRG